MRPFIQKPWIYAMIFTAILSASFLYSILSVFVIPRKIDPDTFETANEDWFTGTIDKNWGNGFFDEPEESEPTPSDDTTAPCETSDEPSTVGNTISPETDTPDPEDVTEAGSAPPITQESFPAETTAPETLPPETDPPETEPPVVYPIITDTLYQDENIRIEIKEIRRYDSTLFVADIRINNPDYLKTALAHDEFGRNITETTSEMANRHNAILAVNGDYYGANESGYVIRNGVLYRDAQRPKFNQQLSYFDDLAIMRDGSFITFDESDYAAKDVLNKGAKHVLAFGPTLVINGQIAVDTDTEVGISTKAGNPRCAIGQVSTGHYLFIVADGRYDGSRGPTLWELADVFLELGAKVAYNLDGGGSATMVFNGRLVNNPHTYWNIPSGERSVSDIVYIGY